MRKILIGIVSSFLTVANASNEIALYQNKLSPTHKKIDVITVNGTGIVEVDPDTANVIVTVTTRALNSTDAQKQNADKTKRLIAELTEKYNLEKEQITTVSYTINAEYNPNDPNVVIGYVARHTLSFKLNFVDGLGGFLDSAIIFGATSIEYIQFGLQNQKVFELESLKIAMQNAKDKAAAIAESAGRSLIRIVKVTEGQFLVGSDKEAVQDHVTGTEIYPRPVTITANISVTYEF